MATDVMSCCSGTGLAEASKVRGWPSYTQSSAGSHEDMFQIGSEEKPRWMWGDNGNGYLFFRAGQWFLRWDCY
jgi:uncharacterized protein YwqG